VTKRRPDNSDSGREGESKQFPPERKVWIIGRVGKKSVFPLLLHELDLPDETLLVGFRILAAATGVFVMIELGLGRIDDSITLRAQLEAEIDVIESDLQMLFVEAAYLEISLTLHQHTSGADRG
jgi:hypothetical protein